MKTTRTLLISFLLILAGTRLQAQQYRWITGGGSQCSMSLSRDWERVNRLVTDGNRNLYALSTVGGQNITADTFTLAASHYSGSRCSSPSTLLTSYNCNGQMRWAKFFDTYGALSAVDLKCDNAGNLFVIGWAYAGQPKHFSDTTVVNGNYSMFISCYDTSGKLRWMRFLGADNAANQNRVSSVMALAIDAQQNPHFLAYCKTGLELSPSITTTAGVYDIRFSPQGTQQSAVRLPIDSSWEIRSAVIVPSGRMYANFLFNNQTGVYNSALMAFTPARAVIWSDTTGSKSEVKAFAYDDASAFYATISASGGNTAQFAGLSATNSTYPMQSFVSIAKVDTNGNGRWMKHWDCSVSVFGLTGMAWTATGNIAATGNTAGTVTDGTSSTTTPAAEGQNAVFLIIDTAGKTQRLEQFSGNGFYDFGSAVTADRAGNIYIGGQVENRVTASGLGSGYSTTGGNTDFFIAKYGYACNCVTPVAGFNPGATTGRTATYTYTGTASGLDSLVWVWGDGQRQKVTTGFTSPVSHTFAANGRYNVCVTAYSSCGSNTSCRQTPLGVGSSMPDRVRVYPNPAANMLHVEHAAGAWATLSNTVGQTVLRQRIESDDAIVDLSELPAGVYILQLWLDADGEAQTLRIVKL